MVHSVETSGVDREQTEEILSHTAASGFPSLLLYKHKHPWSRHRVSYPGYSAWLAELALACVASCIASGTSIRVCVVSWLAIIISMCGIL